MTRLNLMLLAVVVLCSLGVVMSQHKARKAYSELQKLQADARALDIEWGQLQLEQSTWATHSRIETEAGNRLSMRVPDEGHLQVVVMASGHGGQ